MANETESTPNTLEAATQAVALPRLGLVLLGTTTTGDSASALVRVRPGDIRTIKPGDTLGTFTVFAVEPGAIHLVSGSKTRKLEVPEG